jgi:hypothetical protein
MADAAMAKVDPAESAGEQAGADEATRLDHR